VEKVK